MRYSKSDLWHFKELLLGTCNSIFWLIDREELSIDADDLEDELLDVGLERCKACEWWFESSELIDSDDEYAEPGYCEDCR